MLLKLSNKLVIEKHNRDRGIDTTDFGYFIFFQFVLLEKLYIHQALVITDVRMSSYSESEDPLCKTKKVSMDNRMGPSKIKD